MELQPLTQDELDARPKRDAPDEEWLKYAGRLAHYLDARLVRSSTWDERSPDDRPPLRLCTFSLVFEGRDKTKRDVGLFARLDDEGRVTVGCTSELCKWAQARLHDFARGRDEVVTLAVTRQAQVTGRLADLWLVGRTWDTKASRHALWAYHGRVTLTAEGTPALSPALDTAGAMWSREIVEREEDLPALLRRHCVVAASGDDLFDPRAEQDYEAAAAADGPRALALVAWTPGALAWARDDDSVAVCEPGSQVHVADWRATPRVRALALHARRAQTLPARGRFAALQTLRWIAADDTGLAAFDWPRDEAAPTRPAWRHRFAQRPRALAFVGGTEGANGWPDILVAFRDGTLERFRYVEGEITRAWEEAWARLEPAGAGDIEARLEWLRGRLDALDATPDAEKDDGDLRQALQRRALQLMLEAAPHVRAERGERWIADWAPVFAAEEPAALSWPFADLLIQRLRELGEDDTDGRFVLELTHAVYNGYAPGQPRNVRPAPVRLQEWIDREVRRLDQEHAGRCWPEPFQALLKSARQNRLDLRARPDDDLQGGAARRAELDIDLWANRFELTDGFATPRALGRVEHVAWLRAAERTWLVLGSTAALRALPLNERGRLQEQHATALPLAVGARLSRIETLHAAADERLLAASADGKLRVFELEGGSTEPRWTERPLLVDLGWQAECEWAALACLSVEGNGWLVAASILNGRRSRVHLWLLDASASVQLSPPPFDIPNAVRALDLAIALRDPKGSDSRARYRLVVGEGDDAHAELWDLNERLQRVGNAIKRAVDSRVLAVAFDDPARPQHAVLGDRAGLIWGVDLAKPSAGTGAIERLRWIYQLQGPIVALAGLAAEPAVSPACRFVAVSEAGVVALLDAASGRRLWKHRFHATVRAVSLWRAGAETAGLALALDDGSVRVFRLVPRDERDSAIARARSHLLGQTLALAGSAGSLNPAARPAPPRQALQEAAWALSELHARPLDASEILGRLRHRSSRARLVGYLARGDVTLDVAARERVVERLTYRDLALLSSYLPDADDSWDTLIARRLADDAAASSQTTAASDAARRGDNGPRARMHAYAMHMQRLSRRGTGLTPAQVLSHRPKDALLSEHRWLRLQLGRILLQALHRAGASLPELLERLSELPPEGVEAASRAGGQLYPHAAVLQALGQAITALLRRQGDVPPEALSCLAVELPEGLHAAGLLRTLASLTRLPHTLAEWPTARADAMVTLRQVVRHAAAPAGAGAVGAPFCLALAALLPKRPMPEDADPLKERLAWLNEAQGSLANAPSVSGASRGWERVLEPLLGLSRARLRAIVEAETRFCNALVRARVQMLSQNRVGALEVRLRLEVIGEGARQLTEARVEIDAGGSGGLTPTRDGALSWQHEFAQYPSEPRTVVLRGGVQAGQKQVSLVTRVSDRGGYTHEDIFVLPIASSSLAWAAADFLYPDALRVTFETLRDEIFTPRRQAALLIADEEVGRDAFLEAATLDYAARLVDVREILGTLTTGLTARERVQRVFQNLRAGQGEKESALCIVSGLGALGEGLGDEGSREVLGALQSELRAWNNDPALGRLVLAVSGAEAAQHASAWSGLEMHDANRPLVEPAVGEMQRWLRREGLTPAEAERVVTDFGADLRLIRRWPAHIKAHRETPGRREPLAAFRDRPEVAELLIAELAGLDDRALLLVMAGATYDTSLPLENVTVGQVARDDLASRAAKTAGKILQAGGSPFSERSLRDLRAERATPQVWVEGCGHEALARSRLPTRLAELLGALGRRRALPPGHAWLGVELGGVWRTASPYRQLIRGFYERDEPDAAPPALSRDAAVFHRLRGEQRLLADVCTLDELAKLSDDLLGVVLPATSVESRRALRRLLRRWRGGPTDDDEALLRASFGPPDLHPASTSGDSVPHTLEDLGRRPGVKLYLGGGALRPGVAAEYLYWLEQGQALTLDDVRRALDGLRHDPQGGEQRVPGVRLTGPGARHLGFDMQRHIGVLSEADLRWAAARGDLRHGLEQRRRAQQPLGARSPYRSTGALPPGSPVFKGRQRELAFVREHLRQHCVLIVGARRIGKTSLLHQIEHWLASQADLLAIPLDLQGVGSREGFESALRRWAESGPRLDWSHAEPSWLQRVVTGVQRLEKRPIFLLNEIDRPLRDCPALFEELRGFVEAGAPQAARCVMVGYATAQRHLTSPESPLYHFTQGQGTDQRALTLRNLGREEAREIIDLLERELDLVWATGQREPSYELLLERSYGIPWLLQALCQALVERLEERRQPEITRDDVVAVVARASTALEQHLSAKVGDADDPVLHSGLRLVLLALARARYWLPRDGQRAPFLEGDQLERRSPLEPQLRFSVAQAVEIATTTFQELLSDNERKPVLRWFRRQRFDELFRLLTLTLVLELDSTDDQHFGFLMHIFPRELWRRHGRADPRLEHALTDEARAFWVLYESATKGAR